MKAAVFYTTCADDWEADRISNVLLKKKLVVCAKKLSVISDFLWKGKIKKDNQETMLILESVAENFGKINQEIRKLHSYETFVLYSIPVKTTKEVEKWIKEELK